MIVAERGETRPSRAASPPRLRAWLCHGCRRILFKHRMPMSVLLAFTARFGPIEVKCHCNAMNTLGG